MTSVIWKHTFWINPVPQRVVMPDEAVILSVQTQDERPMMWYRCDPKAPPVARWFLLVPTGVEFYWDERWQFQGTVQVRSELVFHMWEVPITNLSEARAAFIIEGSVE